MCSIRRLFWCSLIAAAGTFPLFGVDVQKAQAEAAQKQLLAAIRQVAAVERHSAGRQSAETFVSLPDSGSSLTLKPEPWTNVVNGCQPLPEAILNSLATNAATKNVPADLIRAVIDQESAGRPCALSPKGALGLMQLMPLTARSLGVTDPFDTRQNVSAGVQYLDELLIRYQGNLELALAAYNAGPGRIDLRRAIPEISETQQYVRGVLQRMTATMTE